MKKAALIILLVLPIFASIIWLRAPRQDVRSDETNKPSVVLGGITNEADGTVAAAPEPPGAESPLPSVVKGVQYSQGMQKIAKQKNGPVFFFGKVIDQDGNGVAGVKVQSQLLAFSESILDTLNEDRMTKTEDIEATTDALGKFSITKRKGSTLRIKSFEKMGYYWTDPNLGAFYFGSRNSQGDRSYTNASRGVTFHVWKKGDTEPLIHVRKSIRFDERDSEHALNLFSDALGSESLTKPDLRIKLRFVSPNSVENRFDQELTIEAPSGGLVETQDIYPYRALSVGHAPSLSYRLTPTQIAEKWEKVFYVKTRGALTAALKFTFSLSPYGVEITGVMNPSGSQNLERDPAKEITNPEEMRRLDEQTSR